MPEQPRLPAETLAIAAVAICCAVPAIAIVVAGVIASGWGAALRLWPVSVAGLLLLGLGSVTLVRRIGGRKEEPLDLGDERRVDGPAVGGGSTGRPPP